MITSFGDRTRTVPLLTVCALLACTVELSGQPASWLSAELRYGRDDQPRHLLDATIEYGRYLTPDVTLAGAVRALRIGGFSSVEPGLTATASLPAARLELEAGLGALLREESSGVPLLWDGRARFHIGGDVSARVNVARSRYTATLASLDTAVLMRSVEARIDRAEAPGWAGELVARRESFGDGNPVTTLYAWILAPLSRSDRHSVRVGYSPSWQDAAHSNWVADDRRRGPPGAVGSAETVPGRYEPYYTPHEVVVHNLLGAVAYAVGDGWIRIDGAYGVRASEIASVLTRVTPEQVDLGFYERTFSPYRASVVWTAPVSTRTWVTLAIEHSGTAFYRETNARVAMVRYGFR